MKRLFLYVLLLCCIACSKKDTDEYATGNDDLGIVGKWKLVQSSSMDSWGNVVNTDRSNDNIILSFDSSGDATYSTMTCKGKYTFKPETVRSETSRSNMTLSFECNDANTNEIAFTADYFATFRDQNYLIINETKCVEMCVDHYRRLRD